MALAQSIAAERKTKPTQEKAFAASMREQGYEREERRRRVRPPGVRKPVAVTVITWRRLRGDEPGWRPPADGLGR